MHISSVELRGFRGIDLDIPLSGSLSLLAGPNNSGKSAVVDAIRTVLQPNSGRAGQRWLASTDFSRPTPTTEGAISLRITLEFAGIEEEALGTMLSLLDPSAGDDRARLTLRGQLAADGKIRTTFHGGTDDANDVEWLARDALRFVYLPALRDAVDDLRPGHANRLPALVSGFAPQDSPDRTTLVDIMTTANEALSDVPAIRASAKAIGDRLAKITGAGTFVHNSDIGFAESRYERIVSSLQAIAGDDELLHLAQNGLGYNNLLYIAVILAALESNESEALNVLLIEEPEAHLHPQLQALLMQYFEGLSTKRTQLLVTTHSAQFASSARLERITVLERQKTPQARRARALARCGLSTKQAAYLHRFLDVTRSALLFAQRVVLVEGIAEQLLIPALATIEKINLLEEGVSVVNVSGVAFEPFMQLFGSDGIGNRCAVLTDGDPVESEDGTAQPSKRSSALLDLSTDSRRVWLSEKTLEWDLAYYNFENAETILSALGAAHPRIAARLRASMPPDRGAFADAVLSAVEDTKGIFAQELASIIENGSPFVVPDYISDALIWVTADPISPEETEAIDEVEDELNAY